MDKFKRHFGICFCRPVSDIRKIKQHFHTDRMTFRVRTHKLMNSDRSCWTNWILYSSVWLTYLFICSFLYNLDKKLFFISLFRNLLTYFRMYRFGGLHLLVRNRIPWARISWHNKLCWFDFIRFRQKYK